MLHSYGKIVMMSEKLRDLTSASTFTGIGRLKDQQKFCDLKVTVKGESFSCHRVVLASVSKFFETRLSSTVSNSNFHHVEIDHEDVSPTIFGSLLEILYKGKDLITLDSVQDFLKMSLYLEIDYFTRYCEEFILNVDPKDCLGLWQFAQSYKLVDLSEKCSRRAAENIDILAPEDLLALPKSMMLILLSLQKKLNMDDVCKTILRWVESDQDTRSDFLTQFIPFISFPLLSRAYLAELIEYQNHPFSEHVKESIVLALINNEDRHVNTCRKILCQQSVIVDSTDIVPVSVVVKATELPLEHGPTLEAWRNVEERYLLAPVPANTGCYFATCTWRNDLYLLGGTLLPMYFAVYKPCDNQWTPLPALLVGLGREKHAMVAVNSKIYVLGGLIKLPNNKKATSPSVWSYDIPSKTWSRVCHLPKSVQESSAAVLGHRIYLFGGQDDRGVNSDLVQCVDTVNDVAYVAGKLPSGACRSRACSNNGVIWVVLPTGQVLQMWENFHLADQREQHLTIEKNINKEVEPYRDQFTVSFRHLSQISAGDHIATCLNSNGLTVIAVDTDAHGCLICDTNIIDVTTGEAQKHSTCLTGAQYFDLQHINIPQVHLQQRTRILEVTNFSSRSSDTHSVNSFIPTPPAEQKPILVIESSSHEQRETASRPKSPASGEEGGETGDTSFSRKRPHSERDLLKGRKCRLHLHSNSLQETTVLLRIINYLRTGNTTLNRVEDALVLSQSHK